MGEEDKDRDLLRDKQVTHIKTTMIGSVNLFEKMFPELVGTERFMEFRNAVLDLGNGQIRMSRDEFDGYTVSKRRYVYKLPVMRRTED